MTSFCEDLCWAQCKSTDSCSLRFRLREHWSIFKTAFLNRNEHISNFSETISGHTNTHGNTHHSTIHVHLARLCRSEQEEDCLLYCTEVGTVKYNSISCTYRKFSKNPHFRIVNRRPKRRVFVLQISIYVWSRPQFNPAGKADHLSRGFVLCRLSLVLSLDFVAGWVFSAERSWDN